MARIQISYANLADAATLSGGVWLAGLPLANLQDRLLSRVARSNGLAASSTRIDIDLGSTGSFARLVGLCSHSMSTAATYQVTAGTSVGASDRYDSGTRAVWPTVYLPGDLEWEADNWWTGQITPAEALGYTINLLHDSGANITARYWRLQITDTTNPAGYVQAGRLWVGTLWSPLRNYAYGASLTWESGTVRQQSLGSVNFFDRRPSRRVFTFQLPYLTDAEAFGTALEIQRRLGTDGEAIVIPNPADAQRRYRRDMLGTLRQVEPLSQIANGLQRTAYTVEEVL